jgi:cytochrome c oxidase subunit I+III
VSAPAAPGHRSYDSERHEISDAPDLARLEATWSDGRGLWASVTSVDHVRIGRRYILTAFAFFLLAGLVALLMRLQLARAESGLIGPDLYNQLFTLHGSTMMFLFAVPIMQGFGVYLVPLMVGARNVAFPRLNAWSYFVFLFGGLLLFGGFLRGMGPDAGWFSYVPLSGPEYSPGKRVDIWAQMITFTELSALGVAVNLIVTIFKHRGPGMSLDRLPLFTWASLVTSFMVIFAMPAVMVGSSLLALDRLVGTHFFNTAEGGDALLWQHMFWFFGHPEVYIIFLPALGMVSAIVVAATRRAIFGYRAMVLSLVATAFMGFGLWVHHMFTTGLPGLGEGFFTAASMMIALPSGAQIFCWIATLWLGRPRLTAPLCFVLGFIAIFVLGGLTGVMLASVPLDLQVHDTYFVVAHFHYVLIGGAVFPLFGGLHHWFPKFTGRILDERLAYATFALMFIGFNLTFFPMHLLGLEGMPRRVYTYLPGMGYSGMNVLATVGAFILGLGVLAFVVNALWSSRRGRRVENPWHADSLEWATMSPPPAYKFAEVPVVDSRYPLWAQPGPLPIRLRDDRRAALVTTLVDANVDHTTELPGPSPWPAVAALATAALIVACIFTPWGLPVGGALLAIPLIAWFWPHPPHKPLLQRGRGDQPGEGGGEDDTDQEANDLSWGSREPLFWGVSLLIVIETGGLALLLASYFYLSGNEPSWPPPGVRFPPLWPGALGTAVLLMTAATQHVINRAARIGDLRGMRRWLVLSTAIAVVFVAFRFAEFHQLPFYWDSHAYGSIVWVIIGYHTLHALTGVVENLMLIALLFQGPVERKHALDVQLSGLYWYFMVAAWLPCFASIYLGRYV